jgi:hypothetical protein
MRMGDRVRWFFGDTVCVLGTDCSVFEMTSAHSSAAEDARFALNLTYEANSDGSVRPVAQYFSPLGQATWIQGLFPASNASGIIYGNFASILPKENRNWDVAAVGITRWDESKARFCKVCPDGTCDYEANRWSGACDYDLASRAVWPGGMAHLFTSGGVEHAYFENYTRVGTETQLAEDPSTYEAFTPILPGTDFVERDESGRVVYRWRTGAPPYTPELHFAIQKRVCSTWLAPGPAPSPCTLTKDRLEPRRTILTPGELLFAETRDIVTGQGLFSRFTTNGLPASDSIAWNPHRERFTRIIGNYNASSSLGDVYYGESDTPVGPFVYARRVVNHDRYTFYNPTQYPFFARDGGRQIFFGGTHTLDYVSPPPPPPTPRDHYNMFMYQLDLDDPRTFVPVPVYSLRKNGAAPQLVGTKSALREGMASEPEVEFFAYDRDPGMIGLPFSPVALVPVAFNDASCRPTRELVVGGAPRNAAFFALPATATSLTNDIVPLYKYTPTSGTGGPIYTVSTEPIAGYQRDPEPLVKVWRNPISKVRFPVRDYLVPSVSDAGVDRCLREVVPNQPIDVVLDPRRPPRPSPELATYTWSWSTPNGSGTASGPQPTIQLRAGVYPIHLQVTLPDGTSSSDTVIISVGSASSNDYAGLVQADAPFGYWRLDDAVTLDHVAKDLGWGAQDGTYSATWSDSTLPWLGQPGAIRSDSNTAAYFSISNNRNTQAHPKPTQDNWVAIPHHASQLPTSLSVEAWFTNPRGQQTYAALVSKTARDYGDGYGLYWYPNNLYFYVGGRMCRVGTPIEQSGAYHHVVGTFDNLSGMMRIYLDGVEMANRTRCGAVWANEDVPVRIAKGYLLSWGGNIDEVALYDHALPERTIQAHHQAGVRAP